MENLHFSRSDIKIKLDVLGIKDLENIIHGGN